MSQLLEELREEFRDEDSRYAYIEAHLNASVAAQIKAFRGEMRQEELAEKIGTKQSGISRLENANYSAWKVETLRKLARAFGLRLHISFEEFGTLAAEIENFKNMVLKKRSFGDDPAFKEATENERASVIVAAPQRIASAISSDDLSWSGAANTASAANTSASPPIRKRRNRRHGETLLPFSKRKHGRIGSYLKLRTPKGLYGIGNQKAAS